MKKQLNNKKITLDQAVHYAKESENFNPAAHVVIRYRTKDVFGYKGSLVYGKVDRVEVIATENGDTNYFHLGADCTVICDFQIEEYILIERTASQIEAYARMFSNLRFTYPSKSA